MGLDQIPALQMAEHILKEYRTLDCACCNQFFGYVHRQTGAILCSSTCLSVGPKNTFPHVAVPAPIPLNPQQISAEVPPTEKYQESTRSLPKIERVSKTKDDIGVSQQTGTEAPGMKKTEDVVDHCSGFSRGNLEEKKKTDTSLKSGNPFTKNESAKPVPADNKWAMANSEKNPLANKENMAQAKSTSTAEVRRTNKDSSDSFGSRKTEQTENNPFMKETKERVTTPARKEDMSDMSLKDYFKNVDTCEERNPFMKESKTPAVTHKGPVQKENVKTPTVAEKNPFPKENVKTPTVAEKNPFPKENIKTPTVAEKNPFPKESVKAPALKEKVQTPKDESDIVAERNPFLKAKSSVPAAEEKNPFPKNNAKTTTKEEKNPFGKENAKSSESKPISDVRNKVNVEVCPSGDDVKEENVVLASPPIKVKETKIPSIKDVVVVANPIVLKLRSELPWPSDPSKSMGQILGGAKCNDNGPRDFFFQTEPMFKKLTILQVDIAKYCSEHPQRESLENLTLGQLVFATYAGETFRGEVIGIPKADVAEVFFVDYGNTEQIPRKQLSPLAEEFFIVPRLCFHCQWDYWVAIDQNEISEALAMQVTDRFHSCDTVGLTPLLKIADGQYLVAIGEKQENVKFTVKNFYAPAKVPMKSLELPKPMVKPTVMVERKKYMFKDCDYSPSLQDGADVKIGFAWSCVSYLIMSVEDEDALMKMQLLANEGKDKAKKLKSLPDVGEVILAPYLGEFYRAKVVAHDEKAKDTAKVMFFDFGDSISLKFGELCEATNKIMKHPIYAMNCLLDGVPEPKKPITLDHAANEFIGGVLQLQIKKRPVDDSDVFLITLWNGDETVNNVIKRTIAAQTN